MKAYGITLNKEALEDLTEKQLAQLLYANLIFEEAGMACIFKVFDELKLRYKTNETAALKIAVEALEFYKSEENLYIGKMSQVTEGKFGFIYGHKAKDALKEINKICGVKE